MTQLKQARLGNVTPEMREVAKQEGVDETVILQGVAQGTIVIPANVERPHKNVGIGQGLTTKVSASIGTAKGSTAYQAELAKLACAIQAGAHTIMDLSIGGDIDFTRREIISKCNRPIGTLPIYQTFREITDKSNALDMSEEDFFKVMEKQAQDGVDFMGLHCAMTLRTLEIAKKQGRLHDVVSWGGSLLAGWMLYHGKENPLYTNYDRILDLAQRYDITLSLADGLRPGCIFDSLDRAQVQEMIFLGELVDRAREAEVQIMIKGPGHAPLSHLETTVRLMKQACQEAPYFIFGPVVSDIAPGYDHITAAIGAAISASKGVDFICYVTPAEHVGFPSLDDVRTGVITSLLAAHIGDLEKGHKQAWDWELAMDKARNPWDEATQKQIALDPTKLGASNNMEGSYQCTKCGAKCAKKVLAEYFGKDISYC
ncbi:MAG: phosphomethylpyrimidine synthase ThiC [Desulfitobacteriaceae bacterium]